MSKMSHDVARDGTMTCGTSVIITTYNRRDALIETLRALADQTVPPATYEIIVVDDGSTDGTFAAVRALTLPCTLRMFRHDTNRGISAARNVAIRMSSAEYVIFVSDDLIVPRDFIEGHMRMLRQFHGCWIVGGLRQLPTLRDTPFGRYLDDLEESFVEARKEGLIAANIWELRWPTARNLALPRSDLERIGLFDEQFRVACEDQDLTHRARDVGIRFLYNSEMRCLHNDQVGDLKRYCLAQLARMRDTALFCAKYPALHGEAAVAKVNGYLSLADSASMKMKKVAKLVLSQRLSIMAAWGLVDLIERWKVPEIALRRLYRLLIGLYMFRGWRAGLRVLEGRRQLINSSRR